MRTMASSRSRAWLRRGKFCGGWPTLQLSGQRRCVAYLRISMRHTQESLQENITDSAPPSRARTPSPEPKPGRAHKRRKTFHRIVRAPSFPDGMYHQIWNHVKSALTTSSAVVSKKIISEHEARELFRLYVYLHFPQMSSTHKFAGFITDVLRSCQFSIRSMTLTTHYTSVRPLLWIVYVWLLPSYEIKEVSGVVFSIIVATT
jgi:hypothetical protein